MSLETITKYVKEKHLGAALAWPAADGAKSVDLRAAVLQFSVRLEDSVIGKPWKQRDRLSEVVVPMSVLEALGKDVYAGQLVYISSAAWPERRHVARLIPVEACKPPLLPSSAAAALGILPDACVDTAKRPIAMLSPFLAFNMGIPYHLSQLLSKEDFSKSLHSKMNRVTISTFGCAQPGVGQAVRKAWVPGPMVQELPLADEVVLMRVAHPERTPPFDIVDHHDAMQAMAQAMSGGGPPPPPKDEPEDDGTGDELQKAEMEAADKDMMEGLQSYLQERQIVVCLGDVVGIVSQATPLLGPLQTRHNPQDKKQRRVVYFKVTSMKGAVDRSSASEDAATPQPCLHQSMLMETGRSSVMIGAGLAASDVPVGGETFLLDELEQIESRGTDDADSVGTSGQAEGVL